MAPTEGRVARPERRRGCRRGTPPPNNMELSLPTRIIVIYMVSCQYFDIIVCLIVARLTPEHAVVPICLSYILRRLTFHQQKCDTVMQNMKQI